MTDMLEKELESAVSSTVKVPKGWEPYAEEAGAIGSAIVKLPRPHATARDLLIQSGFDPDEWEIDGVVNTRKWMSYAGDWLYYYKFNVKAGESPEVVEQHVSELVKHIRRRRPAAKPQVGGTDAWAYFASDWQIGKKEGDDGTPQTVDRVLESIDMAKARVKSLRRIGHKMPTGAFVGLGDIGEGTCGFYPGQQFLIDRNRRDQGEIVRELVTHAIDELRPLFDEFKVACVGGNHGELRTPDGQRITSDGDNDDCAYFDQVQEAFDRSGSDIKWFIQDEELTMLLELGGVPVGLTHGHLFQRGKGTTAGQKAVEWWKGQDFGMQALREAQILVTAHFHHFLATTVGSRVHFQTPAMDPGSKWYREIRGEDGPPGTLTMRFDDTEPLGFGDLQILAPGRATV